MIFVDGHIHIYDCFDVGFLFDSAWHNFQAVEKNHGKPGEQSSYVLLLAEGKNENWFNSFVDGIGANSQKQISGRWHGRYSNESVSVTVFNPAAPDEKIHIVPGRQVVTGERIEVLGLFCNESIAGDMPLDETIRATRKKGAIPVLPWGVGKWLGKRGKLIESILRENSQNRLFVGDNGGRPFFWPTPALFTLAANQGVRLLSGTDLLPLKEEAGRIGSFGFWLDGEVAGSESVVTRLKQLLFVRETQLHPYGSLLGAGRFLTSQLRLRLSS